MAARAAVRVGTALVAGAVILSAGACSSDDGSTGSGDQSGTSGTGAAGAPPTVMLDGGEVSGGFDQQTCHWGHDEGARQLEYTATSGSDRFALDAEIVLADPPKLDDFALTTGTDTWKASGTAPEQATVTVDGDRYSVSAEVSEGHGPRTSTLSATFTCADG